MTETNEQLKAEINAITTHVSDTDRRVRALETTVKQLAADDDVVTFNASVSDPQFDTQEEKITNLTRDLDGARKVTERWKLIVDERTDERDGALRRVEELELEMEELKGFVIEARAILGASDDESLQDAAARVRAHADRE